MQLDEQMVEFKIQTDDIWTQMLGLGAATPSTRQRRQGKDQYGAYEAQGVNPGPVCGEYKTKRVQSIPYFPSMARPEGPILKILFN
nr:C. briggsae CBR-COL-158 protein [Haemonchus contortus]